MSINGQITTNDAGERFIFALVSGFAAPLVAHESHPNFSRIAQQFLDKDESGFAELFDIPKAIERGFQRLSERVAVRGNSITFDGDEVHGTLVDAILRFMDEGEDFGPLVKFFENIAANPNDHSREQLFNWLQAQHDLDGGVSIDSDGMLVAYKGVGKSGDGSLQSVHSGQAIVDGEQITGRIPNRIGSIIEMPRSEVMHDPRAACSRGLHVGTYEYAKSWAQGAMLRVSVNPRDVVSVPTDAGGSKVRVCRYVVEDVITEPVKSALVRLPEAAAETLDDGDLDLDDGVTCLHPGGWDADESGPVGKLRAGDRIVDTDGDEGVIIEVIDGGDRYRVDYAGNTDSTVGTVYTGTLLMDSDDVEPITDEGEAATGRGSDGRLHGKGGPTSQAAKGRGRNPAQDSKGRFSGGRPGSQRDSGTGRFSG